MSEGTQMNTQTPHGIPVKVLQPDGDVKTFMIASVRKCPELAGLIKAIDEIDKCGAALEQKLTVQAYKAQKLQQESGKVEDFEAISTVVFELSNELQELREEREEAIMEFYMKGFHAAGYTEDQITDVVFPCISTDMYNEIRSKCRLGCGWVDFSRQE